MTDGEGKPAADDAAIAAIVDQGLEEAAQAIIQPDVPLQLTENLTAAVQGKAVADVLALRVRMIVDHGYTVEADEMLPIGWLPMEARQRFEKVRDMMGDEHRDLAQVRATVVEGVAFGLAALDRLDRALAAGWK